ncbi:MAG: DNA repair protein RadA [Candidatus Levybacteria bacterium RIFCSPLOWO2_01_FULL_36_13]|nr:MAG: DNA repair protein RadA [Candidatus Levybacteria bacterium RIFCSPHIGHO2_01_FULL_36_15b]OGH35119.1 MAG: DNA repair protein RadA [Candidatus Levybacteria bacterium RIFCSPLOWO2_01_FULL_36_13]
MKTTTNFVCQECGYESPKFLGKCPECGLWNTLKEFRVQTVKSKNTSQFSGLEFQKEAKPRLINEIKREQKDRILTSFSEVDTVLGGGIVNGSVTLLAGDPGIGKSTLLLQLALKLSGVSSILYISGEESEQQIKLRAERLSKNLKSLNLYLISTTDTDSIAQIVSDLKPKLVIIDSIQTMQSENLEGLSGSVGQIRYATAQFIKIAKTLDIPVILVGHVTKEGMVAGPMILSHMVDTVLFLEGEKNTGTRVLRSLKNRFGPVDEVGIFSMQEEGMVEVKNPQDLFVDKNKTLSGSVLTVTLEGSRAFLVEIQALAVFSKFPLPRRIASGIDYKRLELILAVLQKHARVAVDAQDVYVNVAGGFKLSDPASDLAVALAIVSSIKNIQIGSVAAIAEVGLLGELRVPSLLEKRIKEAKKLGITKIITPKNYKNIAQIVSSYK